MKTINRLLILVLSVFAMACFNDNPTTPNNGGNNNTGNNGGNNGDNNNGGNGGNVITEALFDFSRFLPLEFQEFTLDNNGTLSPTFSGTLKFDEIKTIAQLNGATGYEINKNYNRTAGEPDNDDFIYAALKDGKQFYVNEDVINDFIELMSPKGIDLPFELPDDTYYKLMDLDAPINQTKVLAEIPYRDDDLNRFVGVNGKIILSITRAEDQKFSYKGQAINTNKAVLTITFDGTYTITSANGVSAPTPTKITMSMNFLIHHKMGIVKQWVPFTVIKLAEGIEIPIKGYQFQVK